MCQADDADGRCQYLHIMDGQAVDVVSRAKSQHMCLAGMHLNAASFTSHRETGWRRLEWRLLASRRRSGSHRHTGGTSGIVILLQCSMKSAEISTSFEASLMHASLLHGICFRKKIREGKQTHQQSQLSVRIKLAIKYFVWIYTVLTF